MEERALWKRKVTLGTTNQTKPNGQEKEENE
jgi:hypothetical protein